MAGLALSISGRLEVGETLKAWVLGDATGLQWQAWVNGSWLDVGPANATSYIIPAGAAGIAYRLAGTSAEGTFYSTATGNAILDTKKVTAPILSGPELSVLGSEDPGVRSIFSWLAFSDSDRGGFGGGALLLQDSTSLAYGGDGHDLLSIRFAGTSAGQFSYNAATREVLYAFSTGNPVAVGTIDAGLNGNGADLKMLFNSNATAAVVDALVHNLQFSNSDDSPTAARLFTLRVTDPTGASAQRVTSVNIENTPDAPVFTTAANFSVDENQTFVATVAAIDPDREAGQPQGISYSLATGAGDTDNARFEVDAATGALRFVSAPDYEDPLHAAQYNVRVRATDAEGSITEQALTVTVRDVNDAPVAAANPFLLAREDGPAITFSAAFTDQDANDTHTITFDASATLGSVSFDGQAFTYDTAGRFEQLPGSVAASDSFTYTVTDAAGLASTQTVTVLVQGENDAAVISGTTTANLQEDLNLDFGGALSASGELAVSDIDQNESMLIASGAGAANLGSFLVFPDGQWRYSVANNLVQSLGAGQTAVDELRVMSWDGTAAASLRVTIAGVNDAPQLLNAPGSHRGDVIEAGAADAGVAQASGTLQAADADAGDTLTWSGSAAGMYGRFDIDASTGEWTYLLDNDASATQGLALGQSVLDIFTATVRDASGAAVQQQVEVAVHGGNDAPQIMEGTSTGVVTESSPDGKLVLGYGVANGEYGIAADAAGGLVIVGTGSDGSSGRWLYHFNADGSADSAFGSGGAVYVEGGYGFTEVALDAAGGYVVGGSIYNGTSEYTPFDFGIARYWGDGALDTSFGVNGLVMLDFGGGYDQVSQILSCADGKLLVAGSVQVDPQGNQQLGLVRLNANGSLDASFGTGGKWVFTRAGEATGSYHVALDPAGRLLVWGNSNSTDPESPGPAVHMARFLADGSADTSFGDQGALDFSLGSWYANKGVALALDAGGGIVLGWNQYDYATGHHINLTRFDTTGTPDLSFGEGGTAITGLLTGYGSDFGLVLDALGRPLIAPQLAGATGTQQDFVLARFNLDGSQDSSFGAGGLTMTDFGSNDRGEYLLTGVSGKIVLAGHTEGAASATAALARYHEDGSLDTTFGGPPDAQVSGWLPSTDVDGPSGPGWSGSADGIYGEFTMDLYGGWTYRLDNSRAATQGLAQDEVVTETFAATASDGVASATQEVVITIVGSYDPPAD